MLTQLWATTINLVASGSIRSKDSALFTPKPKHYTHTQIVGGLIFDITVSVLLLSWLFAVAYRTYGSPIAWLSRVSPVGQDGTEERERVRTNEEGILLGLRGPAWAVLGLIAVAAIVIVSVFVIGDPNFY